MRKVAILVLAIAVLLTGCSASERELRLSNAVVTANGSCAATADAVNENNMNVTACARHARKRVRRTRVRAKQAKTRNEFTIERMMEYINDTREFNGLAPLTFDPDLNEAASIRAQECCVLYSHTRPNGDMCFTVSPKVNGEILLEAPWNTTYERCIKSWIDSPEHKAVLLRDSTMTAGIAYAYYPEREGIYWCVLFDEI